MKPNLLDVDTTGSSNVILIFEGIMFIKLSRTGPLPYPLEWDGPHLRWAGTPLLTMRTEVEIAISREAFSRLRREDGLPLNEDINGIIGTQSNESKMIRECVVAMQNLRVQSDLLNIVERYGKTASDEEVLQALQEWNNLHRTAVSYNTER